MVTASEWKATVNQHPLRFKYRGLKYPAMNPYSALFRDKIELEKFVSARAPRIEDEDVNELFDYDAPDEVFELLKDLVSRTELESLYPMEGVADPAAGSTEWVPLNEVEFICPMCTGQPCNIENKTEERPYGTHYYCGLCGTSAEWKTQQEFDNFLKECVVKLWPYKKT